jgi:hypothetical protein
MAPKIDTNSYVARARAKHGNKYDYSRLSYISMKDDVEIGCPEHGFFWKNARNHLRGGGCSACGGAGVPLDTKSFIQRARSIHEDKYDYSAVDYQRALDEVTIICPEHGEFSQIASHHLSGHGCRKCRDDLLRKSNELFIQDAKKIHRNKYDYSSCVYVRNSDPVVIICPDHGAFEQTPNHHLNGHGCRECGDTTFKRRTTEEFIALAERRHDGRYNYKEVNYTGCKEHVRIICAEHGIFEQMPLAHLAGRGCKRCSLERRRKALRARYDTNWFVRRARKVHGDKYDYSRARYEDSGSIVEILCPYHGSFEINAESHLRGRHCRICTGSERDTDSFVEKARDVHGSRYIYDLVVYSGSGNTVDIVCPKHGKFPQIAQNHLSRNGCPKCGDERAAKRNLKFKSQDEFIAAAREVHGDKYDYSQVVYRGTHKKVRIGCPKHGSFPQAPQFHLAGSGCPECAGVKKKTTEEFVKLAIERHGDKYDYRFAEYVNAREKVLIICPEHGLTEQIARDHLKKVPQCCAQTGFDPDSPAILYYLRVEANEGQTLYKIGISNRSVVERFAPRDLPKITVVEVVEFERGRDAYDLEQMYLRELTEYSYSGPEVLSSGNTELFTCDVLDLDNQLTN